MEKSARICDRRIPASVKRESLQDSSEASFIVWLGAGGTDKKTGGSVGGGRVGGGKVGGGRVEDPAIFVGSNEDGQD